MDLDMWPAYCALCDRGFVPTSFLPRGAQPVCDACTKAMNEEDNE
jgi:hypothetical protein